RWVCHIQFCRTEKRSARRKAGKALNARTSDKEHRPGDWPSRYVRRNKPCPNTGAETKSQTATEARRGESPSAQVPIASPGQMALQASFGRRISRGGVGHHLRTRRRICCRGIGARLDGSRNA